MTYCDGCGRPLQAGDHSDCERRHRATDPPRFCGACGRKLVVQVLPLRWTARCVKCGELEQPYVSADRTTAREPPRKVLPD